MSQISQKSITGITSITTPVGIDDIFTVHSGDTTERFRVDQSGNQNISGIVTATNFKTGSSNLHSAGVEVAGVNVLGADTPIGTGATIYDAGGALFTGVVTATSFVGSGANLTGIDATAIKDSGGNVKIQAQASGAVYTGIHTFNSGAEVGSNIKLGNAGVITATSFVGDGSDLTNLPAGLGTALSATASSPLNKMYYTNQVLGVPSSVTVDVPASASKAYTQYADIKVESSADLIIAEGDDLIPDVLGLADFGTFGGGASAGRIRVNSISNAANDGSPTVQKGLVVTGVCTATTFSGSGASLTNLPAANITGTLPAISGASLTGVLKNIVEDTSPQLGGNLDTNSKNIVFGDSSGTTVNRLTFGDGDLHIYHNGSDSVIREQGTGNLDIQTTGGNVDILVNTTEHAAKFISDGAVELYHNNIKKFDTITTGIRVHGDEGGTAQLQLLADEGDDNPDYWRFIAETNGILNIQDYGSGNWYNNIRLTGNTGGVELYNGNAKKAETFDSGFKISGGGELYIDGNATGGHCQIIMTRSDMSYAINNETYLRFYRKSGNSGNPNSLMAEFTNSGHFRPGANNTFDLGDSSTRWRNIYTADLHCSNKGSSNDVDGTWGDYTIQEGENDLYLLNNRNGKKYKFNLTEVS